MIQIVKIITQRFFVERFFDQAAQMAYYFLLSFVPFLIFLFSLLSFFPVDTTQVLTVIEPFAPASAYRLIENSIGSILNQEGKTVLSFSLLATFWLASMAIQSLVRSMNDAYQIKRSKPFFYIVINDLILTFGFMVIVALSLLVPIGEEVIRHFVMDKIDLPSSWYQTWFLVKWGMGTLFLLLFFMLLYMLVPSATLKWREVIPGAIFATIGWQGISTGFSYYVQFGSYSEIYGQLGSIIILMVWFYLTATVLLIGGLLNASVYIQRHRVSRS
ncbi:YihY/virulence factor BrkB family protein [Bacillus sp. CGMCC 1.16541]|uniref:YihY/virulence factor BrkB family protein n=1 Tax=Bacillus sp. CGMCC 1.16541 TaxID=2185143 RepID=UPI000D731377|nr:YihY/virulence factor BrkB family protein [Bacillus sp. CGMCC 1.16541]